MNSLSHHVHFYAPSGTSPTWLKAATTLLPRIQELYGDAPELWCESAHERGGKKPKLIVTFPEVAPNDEDLMILVHIGRTDRQLKRYRRAQADEPFDVEANDDTKEIEVHVDVRSDAEALCFLTQLVCQSNAKCTLDLAPNVRAATVQ